VNNIYNISLLDNNLRRWERSNQYYTSIYRKRI